MLDVSLSQLTEGYRLEHLNLGIEIDLNTLENPALSSQGISPWRALFATNHRST